MHTSERTGGGGEKWGQPGAQEGERITEAEGGGGKYGDRERTGKEGAAEGGPVER